MYDTLREVASKDLAVMEERLVQASKSAIRNRATLTRENHNARGALDQASLRYHALQLAQ